MEKRKQILARSYIVSTLIFLFAIAIVVRLVQIQSTEAEKYKQIEKTTNFKNIEIKAIRGNLYASDGVLLATTITKYDIRVDLKIINENLYKGNIKKLSDSLSLILGKSKEYYQKKLDSARGKNSRYYRLANGLNYDEFQRLKNFPIFSEGKNKGGLIVERRTERIKTITGFGSRTLGFDDQRGKAGLEGAFSKYLRGINGQEIQQRINQKDWKPVKIIMEPKEGYDIFTTIDIRIQDIAYSALQNQLEKLEADHGCAVVMEVKTGRIVAMANLKRRANGDYDDLQNYAVWETAEPGSTFKAISMLALLDDNYVTSESTVNIEKGTWEIFPNKVIRDEHGSGEISMSQVIARSSNVGIAKMIYRFYHKNPDDFLKKLSKWRVNSKIETDIPGESEPYFPEYRSKNWNKMTLPWMAFGYGIEMTPLQVLTFYNGVANNGTIMKPKLLEKIESDGRIIEAFEPQVLKRNMASQKAINELKKMLTLAVEKGTSRSIYTPNLSMAGKTGTTQIEYWKGKGKYYQASFCGFFPADQPEYSCIVVVNKPNNELGYYGAQVAAPIFKEIAGRLYMKKPYDMVPHKKPYEEVYNLVNGSFKTPVINTQTNKIPNIVGFYGRDAVPLLENLGLKVVYQGVGKVLKQSIIGETVRPGMTVYLKLEK